MDTSQHVRSQLRGTGPSSYGTGPILVDNLGPVPSYSKQYNFSYFLTTCCAAGFHQKIARSAMGALAHVTDSEGKVRIPLRSSEDGPKTSFNQHQSLSGEILPHFDIHNLSVALKLKKLENGPFNSRF